MQHAKTVSYSDVASRVHLANKRTKCTTKAANYNNSNNNDCNNNKTNNHDIHGDGDAMDDSEADVDADVQECRHI